MSRARRIGLFVVGLVVGNVGAGCGGKPAPETAPRGPAPCERVGDHLVGLLTAGMEGAPAEERPTEAIDRLTRVIVELCTRGGWSADAQQCFLTVGPPDRDAATWDRCAGYLTVEQRDELPRAIDAAFGKQGRSATRNGEGRPAGGASC